MNKSSWDDKKPPQLTYRFMKSTKFLWYKPLRFEVVCYIIIAVINISNFVPYLSVSDGFDLQINL